MAQKITDLTKTARLKTGFMHFITPALTVMFLHLTTQSLFAQVTVDNTSSGSASTNVTTITVSHTTGSGTDRLMLVGVSDRENGVISVTYNDDPLSLVGEQISSNNARTHIFSMVNPPNGTFDVVVTTTNNFDKGGIVGVMTFTGVDQNTPLNTYASSSGTSGDPTLTNIASGTNELMYDVVAFRNRNLTGPGIGQTQRWYINSGDEMRGGGSTKPGTSSPVTMTWTREVTNNEDWSMSAVSIKSTPIADLQITKTVNNPTPYVGQTITFTLTATNTGPGTAQNVAVNDLLPVGYTYVSHSTATGTYTGGTGVWDIGTLNASTSATLTINAVVNASGSYSNTATITGDVVDNTPGNNSATVSITPCQAGGTAPLFNN